MKIYTNSILKITNMADIKIAQLLKAGVHFGHKTPRWNPKMFPYIYMERNGIHILDLVQTSQLLQEACDFVLNNESSRGLLICGSGVGMSIAANKIKGIRASNVVDKDTAIQSVEHNDVNVLCLGTNNMNEENVLDIIESFLDSTLIQEERYLRRINKLED